eukprot:8798282-Pyramimonas_sp.AAC.1
MAPATCPNGTRTPPGKPRYRCRHPTLRCRQLCSRVRAYGSTQWRRRPHGRGRLQGWRKKL